MVVPIRFNLSMKPVWQAMSIPNRFNFSNPEDDYWNESDGASGGAASINEQPYEVFEVRRLSVWDKRGLL